MKLRKVSEDNNTISKIIADYLVSILCENIEDKFTEEELTNIYFKLLMYIKNGGLLFGYKDEYDVNRKDISIYSTEELEKRLVVSSDVWKLGHVVTIDEVINDGLAYKLTPNSLFAHFEEYINVSEPDDTF